ncbi:hypothetical protein Sps_03754 [Shewanella psychrophila]|uniref:Flagellar hook-length control protein FliK n=1 Tax=Shewanella psychrophila TaxID=225848 RepID=A0A1S6HTQ2_9GAMM|nr:hypothetical protein [Shewanella psychrophila]AQS38871.1 hypothetical protein Sps_03754 [Shewanella psychrophila]
MSDPLSSVSKSGAAPSKTQVDNKQAQATQGSSLPQASNQEVRDPKALNSDLLKLNTLKQEALSPEALNREPPKISSTTQANVKLTTPTAEVQSLALKPATIQFSSKTDQLSIDGSRYLVSFSSITNRQVAAAATSYQLVASQQVLNLASAVTTNTATISGSMVIDSKLTANPEYGLSQNNIKSILLALGKSVSTPLPVALKQRLNQEGIDLQQMKALSSRPQGYPLPMTQLSHNKLIFSNGTSVPLSNMTLSEVANNAQLNQAKPKQLSVIPSIHFQNKHWLLRLTPVIDELQVKLTPEVSNTSITQGKGEQIMLAKPEIGNIYTQLFKVLSQAPMDNVQGAGKSALTTELQAELKSNHSQTLPISSSKEQKTAQASDETTNKQLSKEAGRVALNKAIHKTIDLSSPISDPSLKTGKAETNTLLQSKQNTMMASIQKTYGKFSDKLATPELTTNSANSLLANLTKLLPQLRPLSLNALALPSTVKDELTGIASFHIPVNPLSLSASPLSHMSSIGLLFQLLLGVKSSNASGNTDKLSGSAQKYLQKLQAQFGGSSSLLNLLDKAGTTEALGKLFSNLSLYSQASSDTSTQVNWYFTLPYSLNQHQEELEGHFSKDKEDDDEPKMNTWRLQLKFNLTKGPLLIQAQVTDNKISMTFNGSNGTLLKKIDALLPPLMNKLSDIGFTPDKVETKQAKVPASLLPGEHFLVKIKA